MASYKVLQDIEAEDTLVGPLTLRQCIYAGIAVVAIYLSVVFVTKGVGVMIIFTLPFIAFGVFFAFPWTKQQSTEVWALAKVRFFLKPRKRIWNQSGAKDLVTVTAPKVIKKVYASTLSPNEVKSRLKALADTIDSRGWAVKNVDVSYYKNNAGGASPSDRLLTGNALDMDEPALSDADASADIFDVDNNPVAQKFDAMMVQAADAHRQQMEQYLANGAAAAQQTVQYATQQGSASNVIAPTVGAAAQAPLPTAAYWHMRTLQPLQNNAPSPQTQQVQATPVAVPAQAMQMPAYQTPQPQTYGAPLQKAPVVEPPAYAFADNRTPGTLPQPIAPPQNAVTSVTNPAILELANNNDLNIATIAREAQARNPETPDEVVVSFH